MGTLFAGTLCAGALSAFALSRAAHADEAPASTTEVSAMTPPAALSETIAEPANLPSLRGIPDWEVFAAIGAPNPVNLGISHRIHEKADVALSIGRFSVSPSSSRTVKVSNVDATIRFRVFDGAFFTALTAKYQTVGLELPLPYVDQADAADSGLSIKGLYLVPKAGFRWYFGRSFSIGFDIGIQLPILTHGGITATSSTTSVDDAAKIESLERSSERVAGRYAKLPLPNLTLIQLGWAL